MPDEDVSLAPETPSAEDMTGSPPTDELDAVEVPGADGEGLSEGSGEESIEESEAWIALERKYPNLHGRELRAKVADKMWESMNFASRTARESEELRAMLAERGESETETDEPQTHPQVEALDKRIQGLYAKDQATTKQQNAALLSLSEADKNIAKIEARKEDAEERAKDRDAEDHIRDRALSAVSTFEARLEAAQAKRQSVLDRWQTLNEKRESYGFEMEKLLTDKDWLTKVAQQQATDAKSAKADTEKFNVEFPQYVDGLIEKAATAHDAPAEARLRKSLWTHVNRSMMVDLIGVGQKDLADLDVPGMVNDYVQEYLSDRDLVSRTRFEKKSAEKRSVTGKAPAKPAPAAKRPPVPPSLMSQGDTTPGMLRARKYLNGRGL